MQEKIWFVQIRPGYVRIIEQFSPAFLDQSRRKRVIAELGVLRPAESVRSPPIRGDGPTSLDYYRNLGSGAAFGRRSRIPKLAAVSRRRTLKTA